MRMRSIHPYPPPLLPLEGELLDVRQLVCSRETKPRVKRTAPSRLRVVSGVEAPAALPHRRTVLPVALELAS